MKYDDFSNISVYDDIVIKLFSNDIFYDFLINNKINTLADLFIFYDNNLLNFNNIFNGDYIKAIIILLRIDYLNEYNIHLKYIENILDSNVISLHTLKLLGFSMQESNVIYNYYALECSSNMSISLRNLLVKFYLDFKFQILFLIPDRFPIAENIELVLLNIKYKIDILLNNTNLAIGIKYRSLKMLGEYQKISSLIESLQTQQKFLEKQIKLYNENHSESNNVIKKEKIKRKI